MAHLFHKGRPGPVWLAVLLLVSVGLYLADARLHLLDGVRGWLMAGAEPLQRLAALPTQLWRDLSESARSRSDLENAITLLEQENLRLKGQMQTFLSLQEENRRLRAALNAAQPLEQDLLLAEVIPVRGDARRQIVLVNRGSRDGVFVGQAALVAEGLLGQVLHVGPRTAEILLLSDDTHAVPVRIARTGQRAIAQGTGNGERMEIRYLPSNADVKEGDVLVTSGLGGIFPPGYPVATVSAIAEAAGGDFARVSARPLAPVDDVREVLLLRMRDTAPADLPKTDHAH